jgi:hypothetical protein
VHSIGSMRIHSHAVSVFVGGVVVGLGLASVAILSMGSPHPPRARRTTTERASFIDGVHPPNAAELHARPAEEPSVAGRLESEAVEMPSRSQRW